MGAKVAPRVNGQHVANVACEHHVVSLNEELRALAEDDDFSGAVNVMRHGERIVRFARGFADRANERRNDEHTRFGVASGTKALTALTIMSLVESDELALETSVRSIVGDDLAHVDRDVTIDHLLTHRSGVGDYLNEELLGDIDDHILGEMSAHVLTTPRSYLPLLNAHNQTTPPGTAFRYNNSGYVMLALMIEKITGSYHDAVGARVLDPAGMSRSGFFRSDELPSNAALGYLRDGRTNVFHLPIIGGGDGGVYLTLDDTESLWAALASGALLSSANVATMMSVVSKGERSSYGRGFWMDASADHVWFEGIDAGVSFVSGRIMSKGLQYTVLANTSSGAGPLAKTIVRSDESPRRDASD